MPASDFFDEHFVIIPVTVPPPRKHTENCNAVNDASATERCICKGRR